MAFGKSTERNKGNSGGEVREQIYLRLQPGEKTIRILDEEETPFWRYWMQVSIGPGQKAGRPVITGRGSPIDRYMASLEEGDPNLAKKQQRMLLNVLDRTWVKKNSKGQAVYADESYEYPKTDPGTGEDLTRIEPEPHNKVLILEFGPQLMQDFMLLDKRTRSREDPRKLLNIWEFDVKIITRGKGRDTVHKAFADDDKSPLSQDLLALPRHDLVSMTLPLPNEACQRILDGEAFQEVIRSVAEARKTDEIPF